MMHQRPLTAAVFDLEKQPLDDLRHLLLQRRLILSPGSFRRGALVMVEDVEPEPLPFGTLRGLPITVEIASRLTFHPQGYVAPGTTHIHAEPFAGVGAAACLTAEPCQFGQNAG